MKKRSRNALISLTALALGATVLLTGCSEDAAGSTAEATSTQQSTTTAATAPTQPAITKTATGATAAQTSELLSSLTHQEMEELISGSTTLAALEQKRFNLPSSGASDAATVSPEDAAAAQAPAASSTSASPAEAPSSYDVELQALINQLYAVKANAESGLNSVGYAKGFDRQGKPDEALKAEAVLLAKNADVVLLCMGLDEIKESEGIDRADMKLAENQLELLAAVAAANPNVVVLLSAGSSLESDWVKDCKALVYGCLGGQAGAGALVEVLTGAQNPCGKLAETWARSYADTPAKAHFGGDGPTVEYREGLYVGYRYYDTAGVPTAFPFGYGLSYTSFAYSDLKADEKGVTLTVTNTGSCAGAEVVQLYVAKPDAKVFRPVKELKGFAKVQLKAGESKTVTIPLDDKAFRYWNVKTDRWEVEGGSYQLLVGASSADIRLTAAVTVAGTGAPDPYAGKNLEHYRTAQVQNVPDAEFEALLGRPIPENKVHIDRNMTLGEMGHGRSPIGWLAAAVLGTLLRRSIKKGKPDLNILFQYNMPLRALAKMTNGAISMGMVDGIVMELQGFWIIGLVRVIFEAVKNLVLNSRMEERLKNS